MSSPNKNVTWVLWLKFVNTGWEPYISAKAAGRGCTSAKGFLWRFAADSFPSTWGDNWRDLVRVLPAGKKPRDHSP